MDLLTALQDAPSLAIALALVFGLAIGSFLNVVILRLPKMMENEWHQQAAELRGEPLLESPPFNLVRPRSHCPACGHAITVRENIPVLGWLMLRGRCSGCGVRISARYPLIELSSGLLAALAVWRFGVSAQGAAAMLLMQPAADRVSLPLDVLPVLASAPGLSDADVRALRSELLSIRELLGA